MTGKRKANGLGSVRELPSGKWQWELTVAWDAAGKRRRKTGTEATKTAAQKALATAIADHTRGGIAAPDRVTLGEWLDTWIERKAPHLAQHTLNSYQKLTRLHIAPNLGSKRLQEVRPVHLRSFYAALTAKGLGHPSQRLIHVVLHGAFEEALRLELVTRNPTAAVRPVAPRAAAESTKGPKALDAEEVAALLPVLRSDRWGAVFEFMLQTGLRRGEACGLRWEHVDFEHRRVMIRENLVSVAGKVQVSTPKTAKSARAVYLQSEALDLLRRVQAEQHLSAQALGAKWPDTGYVFTGVLGGRLNPENLRRYLIELCQRAGVRAVTVHSLRHTHASLMLRRGVPLEVVSERLGHARSSFTGDVYRTVYEPEHQEWATNLGDLLSPAPRALN